MARQERSGLHESAEVGMQVMAAADPYGAAAAALWSHRRAVASAIAGLLAIPVLFIMLLPSLIFGGLTEKGAIPHR